MKSDTKEKMLFRHVKITWKIYDMMQNDQMIVQRREKIRQTKTKNMLRLREKSALLTIILRKNNCDEKNFKSYLSQMFYYVHSF
jgi:hypothetical protein